MAELIFKPGTDEEERFSLAKEVCSIGRDEDCDVILPDTSVSRRHAMVYRVDEKLYRVEDHNSSNGTLVNGETVVTEFLNDGDRLDIGCYSLVFRLGSSAERNSAAVSRNTSARAQRAPAVARTAERPPERRAERKREPGQRSATVLVLDAGKVIHEQAITGETFTIGSSPGCDLVLADARVSEEHAQIVHHDGEFFLEDLESASGTFCNHERIISKELKSGDELSIGRYVLVFEVDDELELPSTALPGADEPVDGTDPEIDVGPHMELLPVSSAPPRRPRDLVSAPERAPAPQRPAAPAQKPAPSAQKPAPSAQKPAPPPPKASTSPQRATPPVPPSGRAPAAPPAKTRSLADTVADMDEPAVATPKTEPAPRPSTLPVKASPTLRMLITLPGDIRQEAFLDKPELTIGRLPTNDIVLDDDSISRVHARLFLSKGTVTIKDQESLNGVQVSGQFVDAAELKHGDLLVLGEIRMEFRDESAKAAPQPKPAPRPSENYAQTIYDDDPGSAPGSPRATTLNDEVPAGEDSVRKTEDDSFRRAEDDSFRKKEDDSFRRAEDDSFRGSERGMRQAETLYEEPAKGAIFGQAGDDAPGPLDKLRGIYEKLGPGPKQRRTRALLGGFIFLGLMTMLVIDPEPPPPPVRKPADQPLPSEKQGQPQDVELSTSQQEAARLARINRVQEAAAAIETQNWEKATELVEAVLQNEPSNVKALSIRETARQEKEVQAKLAQAETLFQAGKAEEAQELLRSISPQSVYYALAESKRQEAQKKNVDRWLAEATRLKDQRKFTDAMSLVRKALDLAPDSAAAKALERDIEKRRTQPERTGPSPEQIAEAQRAEERRQEQTEQRQRQGRETLKQALDAYAAGDAEGALSTLDPLLVSGIAGDPLQAQAAGQAELVRQAAKHYRAAQAATAQDRLEAALAEWKGVLEADQALMGAGRSSRWHTEASTPFAQILTKQGDQLYATGKASGELAGAYQKYKEAIAYVPGYGPARAKLEAIEKEAIELYRLAYGRWETEPQVALGQVEKVLQILPPDHEYARRAQILRDKIKGK